MLGLIEQRILLNADGFAVRRLRDADGFAIHKDKNRCGYDVCCADFATIGSLSTSITICNRAGLIIVMLLPSQCDAIRHRTWCSAKPRMLNFSCSFGWEVVKWIQNCEGNLETSSEYRVRSKELMVTPSVTTYYLLLVTYYLQAKLAFAYII